MVKNALSQMGPCGITCATCDLGNGTVADTAIKLQKNLSMFGVKDWAPMIPGGKDVDFDDLENALKWVSNYTKCFGCEEGGGPPDCAIRICANKRGYELCSECSKLEGCNKFDWLGDYAQTLKTLLKESEGKSKQEIIDEAISKINNTT